MQVGCMGKNTQRQRKAQLGWGMQLSNRGSANHSIVLKGINRTPQRTEFHLAECLPRLSMLR